MMNWSLEWPQIINAILLFVVVVVVVIRKPLPSFRHDIRLDGQTVVGRASMLIRFGRIHHYVGYGINGINGIVPSFSTSV